MQVDIYLESWGEEVHLVCEVDHTPAERETRDCPGCGAYNEILHVLRDGEDITEALSDAEWDTLIELVDDEVAEQFETAAEDAAVAAYEAWQYDQERIADTGRFDP